MASTRALSLCISNIQEQHADNSLPRRDTYTCGRQVSMQTLLLTAAEVLAEVTATFTSHRTFCNSWGAALTSNSRCDKAKTTL